MGRDAFDPQTDYPLGSTRPELIATPSGMPLDEVTLAATRAGTLLAADVRATPETLRLAESYPDCWTYLVGPLVGATPELLVRLRDGVAESRVLAGTVSRDDDADEDEALAAWLLASAKDLEEHEYAVQSVTERLARLALVEREAEDTFGDPETAKAWLLSTNTGLGGCTPFSMLDTDVGAREVTKALMAIAYGGVV